MINRIRGIASIVVPGLLAVFGSVADATAGGVIGNVDGFYSDANGNPVLSGWACQVGNAGSIDVALYLNATSATGESAGSFVANVHSEPAIAASCGTTGTSYRFAIPMPSSQFLAGNTVYVYAGPKSQVTTLLTTTAVRIPVNSVATPNPGSVLTGAQLVVYDAATDANSGCAPLLDAPLLPVSFPSADGQGVVVKFPAFSMDGKNTNYWVTGQLNAAGSETHAFHIGCTPALASPQQRAATDYEGSLWLNGLFKDAGGNVFAPEVSPRIHPGTPS